MARKNHTELSLDTLTLEGSLFMPDLLEKAALGDATHQGESDYQIPKGLKLQDEYGRAFQIACAQFKTFASTLERRDVDALAPSRAYARELLCDVLGVTDFQMLDVIEISGRGYPITAMVRGRVPVVVAPHDLGLDEPAPSFSVAGLGSHKKSAARLAQEFLDASEACTWALVTNGRRLRLLRDAATLTRPTYLEFDLETILIEKRYPDFKALWRILHASRAGNPGAKGHDCIWELWRQEGQAQGNRVREGLRHGVTDSLIALGEGFLAHPSNEPLRMALRSGTLRNEAYFQQLLRLIYRFLFLFTVEERDGILHPPDVSPEAVAARLVYAEGYSMRRLRDRAMHRSGYDAYDDLWQAVRIVFKGLAVGESRLALPALGGLFAPDQCPDLDGSALANHALLSAMKSLRWSVIDGVLSPVDYRNRGFEELGSVYESLLELVPDIDLTARKFSFVGLADASTTAGNARKTTGSYYTPDALVQELIKSALDPVIEARLSARPDNPAQALLDITVIDPACGSGHFLLAAARRLAEKLAEVQAQDGAVRLTDYRHALREVIKHCIYGVDRNPLALELARTALWLDGFEPGRALSFLDHHLICGDALLGLTDLKQLADGIPEAAFKPLSGDDKEICKALAQTNKAARKILEKKRHGPDLFAPAEWRDAFAPLQTIDALPDDTPEQCAAKQQAWLEVLLHTAESPLTHAADLFIGAFLAAKGDKTALITTPTTANISVERFGEGSATEHSVRLRTARLLCWNARVLHWPLAFVPIFSQGGFDCVLANPPWERIKLQEEEFFATRHPLVAQAKNKAERSQRIDWLAQGMLARHTYPELEHKGHEAEDEIRLYTEFITARRTAEAASLYAHLKEDDGGRFVLTGVGDVNTYALFAETISQIVKKNGRAGFIVPSGIATDDSTKAYFAHIAQTGRLVSLYDFENRDAIFPGVHRSYKFCLITLGTNEEARFSFFLTQTDQLIEGPRIFALSPTDFERINPNTRTCPIFRSRADAELTKKIYAHVPVLIRDATEHEPEVNPWGISFLRMFDMANDSHLFANSDGEEYMRLYEAKMIHQFDHRWAGYRAATDGQDSVRDVPLTDKQDHNFSVQPRYWVPRSEVLARIADAPRAVTRAYAEGDAAALLAAFANWVEACFEEELIPTAYRHETKKMTELAGPLFTELPHDSKKWRNDKVKAEARNHPPLSEDEMVVIRTSRDIRQAADIIMDQRSPRWLMGWRDICRSTDERTVIASVMPRVGVGHTMPLLVFSHYEDAICAAFLANCNSLVLDYIARQKVGGTHLTYTYLKQFPFLPPESYSEADLAFIVPRVLELTYTSHDLKPWAEDLGYSGAPFGFDPERRAVLRAELDAYYARLYGLTCDELRYILDPADVMGPDYPSETFRVLKKNEEAAFGEYRTRRLVLEAWDRIAQAAESPAFLQMTPAMLADIQQTIRETSYPVTELDNIVCEVALAVLGKGSSLDSMAHLYAVLLATHPSWCRAFLADHDRKLFNRIAALGPRILRTDITGPVNWKRSRDYLEHLKAITIDRSTTAQSIFLVDAAKQANLPKPRADYIELVMKALSTMLAMKQGLASQNQEQKAIIQILDQQQASEYALAS